MSFVYSSNFRKKYKKLSKKSKKQFSERLDIFVKNEFDMILNNHKLHGKFSYYRSVNIAGDIRLVYQKINNNTYYLISIGSHSELYE